MWVCHQQGVSPKGATHTRFSFHGAECIRGYSSETIESQAGCTQRGSLPARSNQSEHPARSPGD